MWAKVKGYYDGSNIVISEAEKDKMSRGQEIIISYFVQTEASKKDDFLEALESDSFAVPTGRSVEEIDNYVRENK